MIVDDHAPIVLAEPGGQLFGFVAKERHFVHREIEIVRFSMQRQSCFSAGMDGQRRLLLQGIHGAFVTDVITGADHGARADGLKPFAFPVALLKVQAVAVFCQPRRLEDNTLGLDVKKLV